MKLTLLFMGLMLAQSNTFTFEHKFSHIRTRGPSKAYQGEFAAAFMFTNSMADGTSRTNVIKYMNEFLHPTPRIEGWMDNHRAI